MATLINLDKIVPEDKIVVLGGREYTIPGATPVRIMLEILKNAQSIQTNPNDLNAIEKGFKLIYDLLKVRNPDLDYDVFANSIGMEQYIALVNAVYGGLDPEQTKKNIEMARDDKKKAESVPAVE